MVVLGVAVVVECVVGSDESGFSLFELVRLLADVADPDGFDVSAGELPDRPAVAGLAVGSEALWLGVGAVEVEHVAVGLDDHLAGEDDRRVNVRAPLGFLLGDGRQRVPSWALIHSSFRHLCRSGSNGATSRNSLSS